MHPQEPVKSQLHETSGPDGTPDLDIPSVNCKVETLSVPETYTEITEYHNEGYEEITGSVVDSGGTSMIIKREDGSVMWETETVQAAEAISETDHTSKETDHFSEETDHITEETVHISEEADYISEEADYISEETDHISNEVVKERTAQNDVADMSSMSSNLHKSMNSSASTSNILKEDIKSSDPQNIVHVQVEKVNGIKQNIEIDESLPIDENDPVIILQDEDVFNEYIKAEENSNSNKSMEAWERLEHNTEQQNVKKSKKGRPKRKEYSEMCIPVTKDDGTTVFQCEMCGVQMTHYPNLKGKSFALLMSCVARKSVFWVSDQVLHKSGCTATADG